MKYARQTRSVAFPAPLYDALMREVYETKESFSWIVTKRLCAAYNMNSSLFENSKRKPREVIATPLAEVQALQTALPHPRHFGDIMSFPNRSKFQYSLLISPHAVYRWAPCEQRDRFTEHEARCGRVFTWNGDERPIPVDEQVMIADYEKKYAY